MRGSPAPGPARSVHAVVGEYWTSTRPITRADLDGFAAVSGDDNPIHVDPAYAAGTPFALPVAHGMFLFALVRAQLRRRWPRARLLEQRLLFSAPTPAGVTVTIRIEVVGEAGGTGARALRVQTMVTGQDGSAGLQGECLLEPGDEDGDPDARDDADDRASRGGDR